MSSRPIWCLSSSFMVILQHDYLLCCFVPILLLGYVYLSRDRNCKLIQATNAVVHWFMLYTALVPIKIIICHRNICSFTQPVCVVLKILCRKIISNHKIKNLKSVHVKNTRLKLRIMIIFVIYYSGDCFYLFIH